MTTTDQVTNVSAILPIGHDEGMRLLRAELQRNLEVMRGLGVDDWSRQTDCPDWDVRRLYLHVLGACESGASTRELLHQLRAARSHQRRNGGPQEAALSAVQVAERLDLTPAQLVERFSAVIPAVVRGRSRLPALVRRARIGVDGPVVEKWSVGYLVDVIYLRDAWMHRIDVARATGATPVLAREHDGRIVADVVREWAGRHGEPFTLTLTGAAGGRFATPGRGAESMTLDAVEFCRVLAGRSPANGLLATVVPF